MESIVITGAAGFIGSTFANSLQNNSNYKLVLIDSLEFGNIENLSKDLRLQLIITNCLDLNLLDEIIPEDSIIFHFAGISSLPECESNFISSVNNIFISTVNIYEIGVKKKMKKFIFASTSAVYENNDISPFKEDFQVTPDLMYSYSKKISEDYLCFRSLKLDASSTFILRFFNVFGFNQDSFRKNPPLTAYLLNCLKENKEAIIFNDDPSVKRDYIFIDDLIDVFNCLMNEIPKDKLELINVTSGNSYSVEDIIKIINKISKRELKYSYQKPQEIWSKYPDILKKITKERIISEVYKKSSGDNTKLIKYLPSTFSFTSMTEGLTLMMDSTEND
jgi:UDP-glucose 4-epimerase